MNKFDYNKTKGLREFVDMAGFVKGISGLMKVWSWGAHNWAKINKYTLRFTVNGHLHKGYVYVQANGSDLFDITYTSNQSNIKGVDNDIYLDEFVDTVDAFVEWIPEYKR